MGKAPPSTRPKTRSSTRASAFGSTCRTDSAPSSELTSLIAQLSLASGITGRTDSVPPSELASLLAQLSLVASAALGSQAPLLSSSTVPAKKGGAPGSPMGSSQQHEVSLRQTAVVHIAEGGPAYSTLNAPRTPSVLKSPTKKGNMGTFDSLSYPVSILSFLARVLPLLLLLLLAFRVDE